MSRFPPSRSAISSSNTDGAIADRRAYIDGPSRRTLTRGELHSAARRAAASLARRGLRRVTCLRSSARTPPRARGGVSRRRDGRRRGHRGEPAPTARRAGVSVERLARALCADGAGVCRGRGRCSGAQRALAVLPFFHVLGLSLMNGYPRRGIACVTMPRFDLEQMLALIERHRVTLLALANPCASCWPCRLAARVAEREHRDRPVAGRPRLAGRRSGGFRRGRCRHISATSM